MVATYKAVAGAVAYASSKDMLNVFNGGTATRITRVYRCYHFNNGIAAVTGVLTTMQIRRITAATGGTTISAIKFDSNSSNLEAAHSSGTNQTVTGSDIFRRYLWSNDEPTINTATQDEWEVLVPFAEVWNAGYADSNVEPLVCRANQGVEIFHSGSSAVGTADFEIEFTNA
jgi:hypothetical protein